MIVELPNEHNHGTKDSKKFINKHFKKWLDIYEKLKWKELKDAMDRENFKEHLRPSNLQLYARQQNKLKGQRGRAGRRTDYIADVEDFFRNHIHQDE